MVETWRGSGAFCHWDACLAWNAASGKRLPTPSRRAVACRLMHFGRHESKVVGRIGVAASLTATEALTATGATTEVAACQSCAPPAVAMRPHSPCSPGAGRRRTSSRAARERAGNEPLPADDASAQRWRRMWTCDHYSGRGGHFLDGSLGVLARRSKLVAECSRKPSATANPKLGFPVMDNH